MKRFVSIVLIIGLITLGIFTNTVQASHTIQKVRLDYVVTLIRSLYSSDASESFITYLSNNIDNGLILVCIDTNQVGNFTITMWGLQDVGVKWSVSLADDFAQGYFHPNDSTGAIYRCDGYFNSFYNGGNYTFRSRTGFVSTFRPSDSRLVKIPDFSSVNDKLFMGSNESFFNIGTGADYVCLNNSDIYVSYNSSLIIYKRNLFAALVSLYQNVVFYKNDRLYFTFSDQNVFFDVFVGSADAELRITVEGSFMGESGEIEYGTGSFLYHEPDFVRFPDIIIFTGVTNISPNGLRAIDITALSNYTKIVGSRVLPDGYYEMGYFADNEIIISNIISTPVDPYDPLNDAILDLENRLSALENKPVPDYDLQGYIQFPDAPINGASYPSVYNFWVTPYGIALLDDNDSAVSLDVAPRSCLVIRNIEDWQTSYESYKLYHAQLISTLWGQADLVVIVENADYVDIVTDSAFDPIYLYTIESQAGGVNQTLYSSWYTALFVDHKNAGVGHQCFGFFTQHYLDCVNNYILSDGFNMIENGLNKLGDLNKSGFQTVASSVGTVYSAVQVTNSHWVNFLRDFGTFSSDVTHKLENILLKFDLAIDKLNQIEYNTSKEEVGYWYESLWDFFIQFVPTNIDFLEPISALDTGINNLTPIPYVTPPLLEYNNE